MKMLHILTLLILAAVSPSFAVTTVTGHHDNNANGDGFTVSSGSYDVPGTAGTTFNSNSGGGGFNAINGTTSVTVEGGQFDLNGVNGFFDEAASSSISGGEFNGNGAYGVENSGLLQVTGGTFQNNSADGLVTYGAVTLRGGVFGGNGRADLTTANTGSITIYGYFAGLSTGQTEALPKTSGTFTGLLENDTAEETFHYLNTGSMTLDEVPEPTCTATIALIGVALGTRRVRGAVRRPIAEA
jgi:hypothetical protein